MLVDSSTFIGNSAGMGGDDIYITANVNQGSIVLRNLNLNVTGHETSTIETERNTSVVQCDDDAASWQACNTNERCVDRYTLPGETGRVWENVALGRPTKSYTPSLVSLPSSSVVDGVVNNDAGAEIFQTTDSSEYVIPFKATASKSSDYDTSTFYPSMPWSWTDKTWAGTYEKQEKKYCAAFLTADTYGLSTYKRGAVCNPQAFTTHCTGTAPFTVKECVELCDARRATPFLGSGCNGVSLVQQVESDQTRTSICLLLVFGDLAHSPSKSQGCLDSPTHGSYTTTFGSSCTAEADSICTADSYWWGKLPGKKKGEDVFEVTGSFGTYGDGGIVNTGVTTNVKDIRYVSIFLSYVVYMFALLVSVS